MKNSLHIWMRSMKHSAFGIVPRFIYPEREWLAGVVVATLIALGLGVYGYIAFTHTLVWIDENATKPAAPVSVPYDQELVGRVLSEYRVRVERIEAIRGNFIHALPTTSATTSADAPKPTTEQVPVGAPVLGN